IPSSPVPAFAQPVFTNKARMLPPCRFVFATTTGAAQKRLRVKTPATLVPVARVISSKSRRFVLRIPASVTPRRIPLIASKSEGLGGASFTAIRKSHLSRVGKREPHVAIESTELAVTLLVFLPGTA